MRPGEGATSFNKITVKVLTFLNKKVKEHAGRGIHFLENAKKKNKKNSKSNFLLVIVFVFESEGLRLLLQERFE